jgi:hypothetical protein
MRIRVFVRLALVVAASGFAVAASAASADDFKAAYAKAEAANQEAGKVKNQWVTTERTLKAAQAAAAAGDYDKAVKEAQQAEAQANASIAQSKEQTAIWRQAIIH